MVRNIKYPCGICHKNVTKNGILCNECNFWHHSECSGLSASEYSAVLVFISKHDSHTATCDFVSLLLSQHYLPYIIHPTRVSAHSSTIIDNIFSNVCNLDTKSGNILTQIADHFPQFFIVRKTISANKTMAYYQHDYSKFDQETY